MPFIFAGITLFSTLFGGFCALRYQNKLHLLMGFSAGVLLGVVSLDILPEIITQVNQYHYDPLRIMSALVAGFLIFHVFEKLLVIHHAQEGSYAEHKHPQVGVLSALALAAHSFADGVGIGLGFKVSREIGVAVAFAVIAHDFTDGMNSVIVMLTHKNSNRNARLLLILDAVTPLLGVLATYFIPISHSFLVLYLGFMGGFLLYIGASDILPEAHSKESSIGTVVLTVLGAGFSMVVSRLI